MYDQDELPPALGAAPGDESDDEAMLMSKFAVLQRSVMLPGLLTDELHFYCLRIDFHIELALTLERQNSSHFFHFTRS